MLFNTLSMLERYNTLKQKFVSILYKYNWNHLLLAKSHHAIYDTGGKYETTTEPSAHT